MSGRVWQVAAVVVTHDRRDLLAESLTAVTSQTRRPDIVIVVDNASADGTAQALRDGSLTGRRTGNPDLAELVELVELPRNAGGAGGFAAGIARALRRDVDLLWLLDDDTVPSAGALEALLAAYERGAPARISLVASRVLWTDGREHPMNTPRVRPGASRSDLAAAAAGGCAPIRSASFVSVLLAAAAVRECGLPVADYFLWNDDFEFTARLLRDRVGLLCRDSVAVHKSRVFGATDADPGDRFFYEVRNKIWLFTRSSGLTPVERLLYGGSTLRRWVRTFARSRDRATLRRALLRGLAAGLRDRPRATSEVLRDLGVPCG